MAEQRLQIAQQQQQLVTKISSTKAAIQRKLDIPSRIASNVREHPLRWFFLSTGAGLVVSRLLSNSRHKRQRQRREIGQENRKRNKGGSLGKTIRKYIFRTWIQNTAKDYITSRFSR